MNISQAIEYISAAFVLLKFEEVSSIAKKLTSKQQKFVNEYIISGNATQAAIKAGYSKKYANTNANKLLQNTTIKATLNRRMLEIESKKIGDAKEVLEFYFRVLRGEETEEVPMSTADSVVTVTKTPSIKDKVSVAREIMKRFPLYDPMEKQKLKKLTADARISEARANVAERLGSEGDDKLDELMDKLIKESDKKQHGIK